MELHTLWTLRLMIMLAIFRCPFRCRVALVETSLAADDKDQEEVEMDEGTTTTTEIPGETQSGNNDWKGNILKKITKNLNTVTGGPADHPDNNNLSPPETTVTHLSSTGSSTDDSLNPDESGSGNESGQEIDSFEGSGSGNGELKGEATPFRGSHGQQIPTQIKLTKPLSGAPTTDSPAQKKQSTWTLSCPAPCSQDCAPSCTPQCCTDHFEMAPPVPESEANMYLCPSVCTTSSCPNSCPSYCCALPSFSNVADQQDVCPSNCREHSKRTCPSNCDYSCCTGVANNVGATSYEPQAKLLPAMCSPFCSTPGLCASNPWCPSSCCL